MTRTAPIWPVPGSNGTTRTGTSWPSAPRRLPGGAASPVGSVAQAARRVLDEGAVPTYLHERDNHASARVAEAAGFPDRGWRAYGVYPR